jgi:hypothetical protein
MKPGCAILLLVVTTAVPAAAQGIRDRIRSAPRGTAVTKSQAAELTLTVTPVEIRPIQVWVRAAGTAYKDGKVLTVFLSRADADLVKAGQRARAFPVQSRSSMYQARVTRVSLQPDGATADVTLAATGRANTTHYVVEIVTDRGDFLSVPNEAIIEEGTSRVVYVQRGDGQYEPHPIKTGIQGELYTHIIGGVNPGDQVVTFGSFFIDSEYKLKGTAQGATP